MKKLTALMLAMIMILGLCAGCGGKEDTPAATTPTQTEPEAPANNTALIVVIVLVVVAAIAAVAVVVLRKKKA